MQKSKFFELARTLDEDELLAFNKYLKRFHRHDDTLVLVFDYVRKFHPGFKEAQKLEIGYAYHKIFKTPLESSKYNRIKILNTLSDLNLLLKEFLLLEKVKSGSFESRTFWMSILKERGLTAAFSRKAALLQRDVEGMPKSSIADYMNGMVANYFFYYHLTQDKQKEDIAALKDCGNDLDLFYAVCRLKIACETANREHLMSLAPNLEPLPAIIELSKTRLAADHPLLGLYLKVYELISSQQEFHFETLESMLRENAVNIGPEETHTILSYLHNHLALRIRRGDEEYVALTHRLNKFAVEYHVLAMSGEMSSSQFTNIVNVACSVNDLDWASFFIKGYQDLLPSQLRDDSVCLAEAIVLFEAKDYGAVLQKLREVAYPDLYYAIRAKSLILRSLYELSDDILDFCFSFESFLRRHRKPKREAVEASLNFIGFVKKLKRGNIPKATIIKEIQGCNPVYFKAWLLKKAGI